MTKQNAYFIFFWKTVAIAMATWEPTFMQETAGLVCIKYIGTSEPQVISIWPFFLPS